LDTSGKKTYINSLIKPLWFQLIKKFYAAAAVFLNHN